MQPFIILENGFGCSQTCHKH